MYIDWWNRTGPATLGERFGLNEISIARETLSPTKSYTEGGRLKAAAFLLASALGIPAIVIAYIFLRKNIFITN